MQIVMAKSRVAPIRALSVPRSELQAALLAVRLLNTVESELNLKCEKRFLWSDSQNVLRWLRSEPHTRTIFLADRLGEISETTANGEWRWIPTKLNPADYATQDDINNVSVKQIWFEGPRFLRLEEFKWLTQAALTAKDREIIDKLERRKVQVFALTPTVENLPFAARIFGWWGLINQALKLRMYFNRWRRTIKILDDLDAIK